MTHDTKYVFLECGCITETPLYDWGKFHDSAPHCPEHYTRLSYKLRLCSRQYTDKCKGWHKVSKKSNKKIIICPTCRPEADRIRSKDTNARVKRTQIRVGTGKRAQAIERDPYDPFQKLKLMVIPKIGDYPELERIVGGVKP